MNESADTNRIPFAQPLDNWRRPPGASHAEPGFKMFATTCPHFPIQSRRLSISGHTARMDDDADAKMILTVPLQRTGRDHQGVPVSRD